MKKIVHTKSLFEKEMHRAFFHKKFSESYPAFQLEVQLLNELEKNGLTCLDFARAIGTSKNNISRDLKGGGIHHATLNRLKKMAKALKCVFIPLIIPIEREDRILTRIEKILTSG